MAFLLLGLAVCSLMLGSSPITAASVFNTLLNPDESRDALIVHGVRLPRTLAAVGSGAALALAGALMQALTNNPLASPGLLGINAGAAFAVVLAIIMLEPASGASYAWFAFLGAGLAGLFVYALGSSGSGGATPLKLALAGVILSAFLTSATTVILLLDKATFDIVRMWTVGSVAGRQMETVLPLIICICLGTGLALLSAPKVTSLSLGSDIATSIGVDIVRWRLACGGLVILLAGSAVAMAGPVGFVGLVAPHMARMTVGADYRSVLPFSALIGALLVLAADTALRNIAAGVDMPVGIIMALIGSPFFIYLARRRRLAIT